MQKKGVELTLWKKSLYVLWCQGKACGLNLNPYFACEILVYKQSPKITVMPSQHPSRGPNCS